MYLKTISILVISLLCFKSFDAAATTQFLDTQKIFGSDITPNAQFGFASDSDGDWTVIGAPEFAGGAVYVFNKQNGFWVETQKLVANDAANGDKFGSAVALEGNKLLIGAPDNDNSNGNRAGAVYYFELGGNTWNQSQKLTTSFSLTNTQYGMSLSVSGNRAIVGMANILRNANGRALTYQFNGENWGFESILDSPAGTSNTGSGFWKFGRKLIVSGDTVVISDFEEDEIGAVYLYERTNNQWIVSQRILASDASVNQLFGTSIDIDNDVLVIGAAGNDSDSGAVYVFSNNNSLTWTERAKIIPSDPVSDGFFGGTDVAIQGGLLVIGAYQNFQNNISTGAVYLFEQSGSNWTEVQKITAVDGVFDDQFGISLALNPPYLIVGARFEDEEGMNSGAAYSLINDLIFNSTFE